jgi:hypothetical protein
MQTIIYGSGAQSVWTYATDVQGRIVKPATATARIVDLEFAETDADADRIILATSAATVDTFATTTSAVTGPRTADPRKVPIAAGVPTPGVLYVISGAGLTESFEVSRVNSLDVHALAELRHPYASGATVTGCRVSATFPSVRANLAAEVDRRTWYAVDWTFTGVTGPLSVRTYCRIERRGIAPRASVLDLARIDPRFSATAHDSSRLEQHLQQADLEVSAKLLHRGDQQANSEYGDIGRLAVAYAAAGLAYRTLGDDFVGRADSAEVKAAMWIDMLTSGHKADDQVETSRPKDRVMPKRRARMPGVIVGAA